MNSFFRHTCSFAIFVQSCLYATPIEDMVNQARPNRQVPWTRLGSQGIVFFNEYYVLGHDHASGFRALGYENPKETIKTFQSKQASFKKFSQFDIDLASQLENIHELSFTRNRLPTGKTVDKNDIKYGLFDALAKEKKINLFIYEPLDAQSKTLYLSHSFWSNKDSKDFEVHLLYRNNTYNILVNNWNTDLQISAQQKEENYLEKLRKYLLSSHVEIESINSNHDLAHNSDRQEKTSHPVPVLIENKDIKTETIDVTHYLHQNSQRVLNQQKPYFISDDDQDIKVESSTTSTTSSQNTHDSQTETDNLRPQQAIPPFSLLEISNFVKEKTAKLREFNPIESLQQAYTYLEDKLTINKDLESAAGIMILVLQKNFVPHNTNKQTFLNTVLSKISGLKLSSAKTSAEKKQNHYITMFKGQLYIELARYQEAYAELTSFTKNTRYTCHYKLDLARLLIEHTYVPVGKTALQAIDMALKILESFNQKRPTTEGLSHGHRSTTQGNTIVSKLYMNSRQSKEQIANLIEKGKRKLEVDSSDEEEESNNNNNNNQLARTTIPRSSTGQAVQKHARFDSFQRTRETQNQNVRSKTSNASTPTRSSQQLNSQLLVQDIETNELLVGFPQSVNKNQANDIDDFTTQNSSDTEMSIEEDQTSFISYDEKSQQEDLCRRLILQGKAYGWKRDDAKARQYFAQALEISQNNNKLEKFAAQAHIGLGNAQDSDEKVHYHDALNLAQEIGDKHLQSQALIGLGNARDGDNKVHYHNALNLAQTIGNKYLQSQALIGLGNACTNNKDRSNYYRNALDIAQAIGNKSLQFQALIGLGNARDGDDKIHYHNALSLAQEIDNKSFQVQALIGLGNSRGSNRINYYNQALNLAREIGDKHLQSQALIGLGNARNGDDKVHYHNALNLAREIGDKHLQSQAFIGLGNTRYGDDKIHYRNALNLAQEIEDKHLQSQALIGLGNACTNNENRSNHYRNALDIAQEIEDKSLQAQALIGLGNACASNEDKSNHYHNALDIAQEIGDKSLQAQAFIGLGNACTNNGDKSNHYRNALDIAQEIGDKSLQAQAFIGLGNTQDSNRINHYNQALNLAQEIGDKHLQSQSFIGLGNARDGNNKIHYRKALELAEAISDKSLQAQALMGLGNARDGDHKVHYHDALNLAQAIGNKHLQAQALIGLGNTCTSNEDKSNHYRNAFNLAREIGGEHLQAQALIGLGNACASNEDKSNHYRNAFNLAQAIGDKHFQAQACIGLGNARDGNHKIHYYNAFNLAQAIGDKHLQFQACIGLGNARDGDNKVHYYNALNLAQEIGDKHLQAQALIGLGNAYGAEKDNVNALDYFNQAYQYSQSSEQKIKAQSGINRAKKYLELNRTEQYLRR